MKTRSMVASAVAVLTGGILLLAGVAYGAEVNIMISGGFSAAHRVLIPEFERSTHNTVVTAAGPSMGATPRPFRTGCSVVSPRAS